MLIADGAAHVLAVNGKWMELSGLGRVNSLGPGWLSVLEPDARSRLREDVLRVAREGGSATVDYQLGSSSRRRWTRWWISRHELEGLPLVAIGAADVEEDYSRQANLYHLATHDSLTGLINRSHFIECIDQALRRSQRQSRRVAVVYVDLDGFKRVNDQGGHSLGDRVLFAIASRLRHAVRSADMVARIGGDEFAVLCEGLTAAEQADVVARRIALALTESVELDGDRWAVAASVGAAVDRGDPDSAEALVDRADRAMYSIKLARRGPGTGDEGGEEQVISVRVEPERRVEPDAGYAYHTPRPARAEPAPASAPAPAPGGPQEGAYGESRLGGLDPDEGRRALRDLAEAASAFAASTSAGASAGPADESVAPEGDASPRGGTLGAAVGAPAGTAYGAPVGASVASMAPAIGTPVGAAPAGAEVRAVPVPDNRPPAEPDRARHRLAADVVSLRESIDSIRRMLDRLLSAESGIIDIRDPSEG